MVDHVRREDRQTLQVEVIVEVGQRVREYRALDLSSLGLRASGPLPMQEESLQSLRIRGKALLVFAVARVAWCLPIHSATEEDVGFEVGFEFLEMTPQDRALLREQVEALQR